MCEDSYDVIVVGAGHAGIEAALAAARLGARTAIFTLSLDAIGNMPCNPSIGGTAKGHLVFEIDALGGEMSRAADATFLQSRMLNSSKGPAVRSLRVQSDRRRYSEYMKRALERQPGLFIKQAEVTAIECERGAVCGVVTNFGEHCRARAVVVATGTYLGGRIFVGEMSRVSGPDNIVAATQLSESLLALGLPVRRFKTGTPARVHRRSIDYSKLIPQDGDADITPFCLTSAPPFVNSARCYIAYTNERTHAVIRANLGRSPLYGGAIEGIGPRYCPSIEDKVVRFPQRARHQIFVEPCGADTDEMYLQGMSSSLPLDVQVEMYRTIEGFENIEIMRPAYAIEYDCVDPLSLLPTLETKTVGGLFGAGQFNGTSGYEEAAAQGLLAGINAASLALGREQLVLPRSGSYIGTLVDDLVTKGVSDPYRMMTSRSEYRLSLRQDNADRRLCPTGRSIGLLDDARWQRYCANEQSLKDELQRLEQTKIHPSRELAALLSAAGAAPLTGTVTLAELLRRPRVSYEQLRPLDPAAAAADIGAKAEVEIKYSGYLKRQQAVIDKQRRQEKIPLSPQTDYSAVRGLRAEAAEKLARVRPLSLGQAARISGVNPADISVLSIWLKKAACQPPKEADKE